MNFSVRTKTREIWVNSEVSVKGCLRIRTIWDAERQLITGIAGEEHQEFLFSCYFASCYQVHVLSGTAGIRSKYMEAAWLHKTDASVAISWNSLNKLSVQFSSVTQSRVTLCDPMNRSTPGLPVHHKLLEFTQTHVHRVGDAIQPSHLLSSPSPPAPNPSQHQGLIQ